EAAGVTIDFFTFPRVAFLAGLGDAGLDVPHVELLDYLFTTVLDGRNERTTDGVERALGRPARDFEDYARAAAARGAFDPVHEIA
ncbi:MAG: NmrA family transcriptional regulator, partial [Planctomycetota bacterium]